MKKILSIIVISLIICSCFGVQGFIFEKRSDGTTNIDISDFFFDKKIELLMKLAKFPSLSACIIEDDEVTWSNSYGYYDLENKKQATENTIYNIGSISKTITGTALMQLWEKGLFELDEDVNNYLPFSLRNPHFPNESITFRMLLSHSSSLYPESGYEALRCYYWFNFSQDPPFHGYPSPWIEEHLLPGGKWYYPERWSSYYKPGEYNMYANVNFDIIAYLVELISGEQFLDYCDEHILQPLEMYNTSFNLSELPVENIAIPYHYHNGNYLMINELSYLFNEFTPSDKYWRIHMYPTGGLYSSVSDLSHFHICFMNNGLYKDVRILEESTMIEMKEIQPPGNDFGGEYYGLGCSVNTTFPFNEEGLYGKSGGIFGVFTMMWYRYSDDKGVIFFTNGDIQAEQYPMIRQLAAFLICSILFDK